ncbi:MAG: SpoIIE family protein phosphatase [Chloroflexi bacterium]|nr:SpoIIE family protein phosphatase [Chloroflexota bacterium]
MASFLRRLSQIFFRKSNGAARDQAFAATSARGAVTPFDLDIAPDDPLLAYLQQSSNAVEVGRVNLESAALRALKQAGVKVVVPLVSQGELIGLLNLGPRLGEQEYSSGDFNLLDNLATQAAPAVRVAQLVQQQQFQAQERERMAQELRVARLIQQTLLPKQLPHVAGWRLAVHYQPAREVGGDLYDFFELPDGRLVIAVGDVTDKGVPAALVMATTRAVLRGAARRELSPSEALERSNNLLCPEMPPAMFVTCLYAILDPTTGRLQYANAGHNPPYRRHDGAADELRATGMPLGLMPGMKYEEKETVLVPGDSVLLYSDGLIEAHNARREMFGFAHLRELVAQHASGSSTLLPFLMEQLRQFSGAGWEQEDDITMLMLERLHFTDADRRDLKTRDEFTLPSEPGNERVAMARVANVARGLGLPNAQLDRLKTAVAETTMNAIEYGNRNHADVPVEIRVAASDELLAIYITDQGTGVPGGEPPTPNLEAKLAGLQSPRGWGLFLIKKMVDEMNVIAGDKHTVELIVRIKDG